MWQGRALPKDWPKIRRSVLQRDDYRCTSMVEGRRCNLPANEVHHIHDSNDHSPDNLRAICSWHHKRETAKQSLRVRKARTQRYPQEKHPGLAE